MYAIILLPDKIHTGYIRHWVIKAQLNLKSAFNFLFGFNWPLQRFLLKITITLFKFKKRCNRKPARRRTGVKIILFPNFSTVKARSPIHQQSIKYRIE